ncbi:MAG: hypothetical protein AAGM84_07510 [Pseudomonadota bacterium]
MTGWPSVSRILAGVLFFQIGIGALLVIGDIRGAGLSFPRFGPSAPELTQPVRPGDQRRTFNPSRPLPQAPNIDIPDRLVLEQATGGTYTLTGAIAPGDAARIAGLIDAASPPVETLQLQSPGGSVSDALDLGRSIRAAGIDTELTEGSVCYSACPYILAAGQTRTVAGTASVGVHQHYFDQSTILPAAFAVEDIQRGQAMVMIYLDEMGIDPLLMQHAMATPPDEIYVLLPAELETYRIVTPTSSD